MTMIASSRSAPRRCASQCKCTVCLEHSRVRIPDEVGQRGLGIGGGQRERCGQIVGEALAKMFGLQGRKKCPHQIRLTSPRGATSRSPEFSSVSARGCDSGRITSLAFSTLTPVTRSDASCRPCSVAEPARPFGSFSPTCWMGGVPPQAASAGGCGGKSPSTPRQGRTIEENESQGDRLDLLFAKQSRAATPDQRASVLR